MPTILLKKSDTPGSIPGTANLTNLAGGVEVAVNTADKRVYSMTSASAVIELGTNPSSLTCADVSATVLRAGSATITNLLATTLTVSGGTANGVLYLNGSKVATSGSALVFDGSNLGVGTSSPGNYSSAAYNIVIAGTGQRGMTIASTNSDQCSLFFADSDTGTGEYAGYLAYFHNTDSLAFGANAAEKMRLTSSVLSTDSSINVGIGTASPTDKLNVGAFSGNNVITVGAGTTGTSSVYFGDGTGADRYRGYIDYEHTNDRFAFGTAGTGKAWLDSSGNLGIGTSSPAYKLDVRGSTDTSYFNITSTADANSTTLRIGTDATAAFINATGSSSGTLQLRTYGTTRATLDSSGNLGLGVTPSNWQSSSGAGWDVIDIGGAGALAFSPAGANDLTLAANAYYDNTDSRWEYKNTGDKAARYSVTAGGTHAWYVTNSTGSANTLISFTQAMTLDASGNLEIGGTFAQGRRLNVDSDNDGYTVSLLQTGAFNSGKLSGTVYAGYYDGSSITDMASIRGGKENTTSGNFAGMLAFYTRPNGGSDTERARITSGGDFLVGKQTAGNAATAGCEFGTYGAILTRSSGDPLLVNRQTNDGTIVSIRQDNVEEGTISVSGNTVSYNAFAGSHWSQLQDGSKPDILRGTVMESINELCEWPDETNERLPKSKISDTVGSKKVYGVFMAWDNDWTETNDMYVTAVGAFICRVNGSVTVQEGDLLESNGDGTARVQADDIIRSSTIGKVTSTVKTHQYDDGSYCVPTVLYCG